MTTSLPSDTAPQVATSTAHASAGDDNQLITERREKLAVLRAKARDAGTAVFPNDFKPRHHAAELNRLHGALDNETLEPQNISVSLGGRLMLKRVMGKASFGTLQDGSGRIQLFVTRDALGEDLYAEFKHWDLGDILGAEGTLFKTKTGELSVRVTALRLLTKSLRPLPDKFHPPQRARPGHVPAHRARAVFEAPDRRRL
jgi:lysyl-tRNA synthetase class 2